MASEPVPIRQLIRFGEDFELEPRVPELRRAGRVLKLERIPMELLLLLVEQRGGLVRREQIVERIWGKGVFLDTDNSINGAIRKIRQVLKDDPEQPRFIQTLTGRGYRFIAPVGNPGVEEPVAIAPLAPGVEPPLGRPTTRRWPAGFPARATARPRAVMAFSVALLLVLSGLWLWSSRGRAVQASRLTDKDTIVIGDFTNTTGEAVFDDTLKQGLAIQLGQSPFLSQLSQGRVNQILQLMGRRPGERLTPEVTREVCLRADAKAMVVGSIVALGAQYVIGLKAVNCETSDLLAEAQEQAAGKEAVLRALDVAVISMRGKLGESLASVKKYSTPLREATTSSLEALKTYSQAMMTLNSQGSDAALPLLKRTVELDPSFAEAYAAISSTYGQLNQFARAAEYGRRAYDLRERASEVERFAIETNYYELSTGEPENAVQMCQLWRRAYPRDARPVRDLGLMYAILGNHEEGLKHAREALQMGPRTTNYYFILARENMSLNRLEDAAAVFKEAEQRKMQDELLLLARYQLAFLKEDAAQMAQLTTRANVGPGTEALLLAAQADTEAWHGRLKAARSFTEHAVTASARHDAEESAAIFQAEAALREVAVGNRQQAHLYATTAVRLASNRDVRPMAALAFADAGFPVPAEKLLTQLDKDFPVDTLVQRYWIPSVRAAIALQRKKPDEAIELLKSAAAIELSWSHCPQRKCSFAPPTCGARPI